MSLAATIFWPLNWPLAAGGVLLMAGGTLLLADRRTWQGLNRIWRIERFVYRHHRLFGGAIVAGALAHLFLLVLQRNHLFGIVLEHSTAGLRLIRLIELTEWGAAVFALVVGLFVLVRPSLLKGFEAAANRWIEPLPRRMSRHPAHHPSPRAQRWLRGLGAALLLAGAACLVWAVV